MRVETSVRARRALAASVGTVVAAAALLIPGAPAAADHSKAAPSAGCMGHEASAVSPPGHSTEAPRGMRDIKSDINALFPGAPTGRIFSVFAQLEGTDHETCDAAFVEKFFGEAE